MELPENKYMECDNVVRQRQAHPRNQQCDGWHLRQTTYTQEFSELVGPPSGIQ